MLRTAQPSGGYPPAISELKTALELIQSRARALWPRRGIGLLQKSSRSRSSYRVSNSSQPTRYQRGLLSRPHRGRQILHGRLRGRYHLRAEGARAAVGVDTDHTLFALTEAAWSSRPRAARRFRLRQVDWNIRPPLKTANGKDAARLGQSGVCAGPALVRRRPKNARSQSPVPTRGDERHHVATVPHERNAGATGPSSLRTCPS
jgi:hypothetical protein